MKLASNNRNGQKHTRAYSFGENLPLLSKYYLRISISFDLGVEELAGEIKNIYTTHRESPASEETFSNVFRSVNACLLGARIGV
jgi:hypothetical protein